MRTIRLETAIAAPRDRCFLLSLSIDLHMRSTSQSGERAIAGVTRGLIGYGDTVTWEGTHFGLRLRHTSIISAYEPYRHFCDEMTEGAFKSFRHDHFFDEDTDGKTVMRDELAFSAPLGLLGLCAERLVLCDYLTRFLAERNLVIKQTAESGAWRNYLP
jgi:ligand-binding SRPBCC domain-containing protein